MKTEQFSPLFSTLKVSVTFLGSDLSELYWLGDSFHHKQLFHRIHLSGLVMNLGPLHQSYLEIYIKFLICFKNDVNSYITIIAYNFIGYNL